MDEAAKTQTAKIMYEIYREQAEPHYRVVYFTELGEREREREIDRAMAGEHVMDGFIREADKVEAKRVIAELLEALNAGAEPDPARLQRALAPYVV